MVQNFVDHLDLFLQASAKNQLKIHFLDPYFRFQSLAIHN